ncbi:ferric-dicitrate binding protein FerR (iron transport regulator) [Janthinobacterium sp. CG_23.3]|uniref:DUF4880 domain-containing protein n=1 Tax=Janthinobacterium sp. CG_23.3 TaxID=3349634 RepID=UPI0038D37FCF
MRAADRDGAFDSSINDAMTTTTDAAAHWQTALDWIQRRHEDDFDAAALAELAAWLNAAPAHRHAYDEACRVWLAAGLVPPSDPA